MAGLENTIDAWAHALDRVKETCSAAIAKAANGAESSYSNGWHWSRLLKRINLKSILTGLATAIEIKRIPPRAVRVVDRGENTDWQIGAGKERETVAKRTNTVLGHCIARCDDGHAVKPCL
jgi:hypothetical protein